MASRDRAKEVSRQQIANKTNKEQHSHPGKQRENQQTANKTNKRKNSHAIMQKQRKIKFSK